MALTYSSMLPLGTQLINFDLPNTITGQNYSSTEIATDRPVLIMIICNHCPYVVHYHDELKRLHHDFSEQISFVAISSNDVNNYPEDSPEKMKELWHELGFSFPYLYDETQSVAKAYQAECTPEFYLFDAKHDLVIEVVVMPPHQNPMKSRMARISEQPSMQQLTNSQSILSSTHPWAAILSGNRFSQLNL